VGFHAPGSVWYVEERLWGKLGLKQNSHKNGAQRKTKMMRGHLIRHLQMKNQI